MNFIKKTFGVAKSYRPPSGGRKDEYDIPFQEFVENLKNNSMLIFVVVKE